MNQTTNCKYIVAGQYPSGLWNFYFGADDLAAALRAFDGLKESGAHNYKAAAIFTRGQWYGRRDSYRRHVNLRDRSNEPLPASLGMWLVNQADSGYF